MRRQALHECGAAIWRRRCAAPVQPGTGLGAAMQNGRAARTSGVPCGFDGRPPTLDLVENVLPAVLPAGLGGGLKAQMADELLGKSHAAAHAGAVLGL